MSQRPSSFPGRWPLALEVTPATFFRSSHPDKG